ncbi:hypothetical protein AB4622_22630 [Vibrio splendidus]|uniref:hypothetical protein n=1 Tax=Vibrio splendidus TaxID=29497 RepID=UPI00352C20A7
MSNNELISFIKKCSIDSVDLPIRIESSNVLQAALSLFINRTKKQLKVYLRFLDEENNELFEALNTDNIIRNLNEFLNQPGTSLTIITNDAKQVRKSSFFQCISDKKPKVYSLNSKIEQGLTKRSYIISDESSLLVGYFSYKESIEPEMSFINFHDENASGSLSAHFRQVIDLILNGGKSK